MNIIDKINKYKMYLIIPIGCIFFWAFLALFVHDFYIDPIDFSAYYYAGKYIFTDPELIYGIGYPSYYYYLPGIAIFFSFFSLWDIQIAAWIYFFILIIFGVLSIYEFDSILDLKGVENKTMKLLCLIIISNGHRFFLEFDLLNVKIILMFLIILFMKNEIKVKIMGFSNNNMRFLLVQMFIIGLFISMSPPFVFIAPLYLLNNIKFKEILSKQQLIKYGLFILVFVSLNFIVIIYPSLLYGFLNRGINQGNIISDPEFNFMANYEPDGRHLFPTSTISVIFSVLKVELSVAVVISITLLTFFTFLISSMDIMSSVNKFAIFFLVSFFLNIYIKTSSFLFMIPPIILLFLDQMKLENEFKSYNHFLIYFKSNFFFFLGLFCLFLLNFIPPIGFIYKYFYIYIKNYPFIIVGALWSYLFFAVILSLITLHIKKSGRK